MSTADDDSSFERLPVRIPHTAVPHSHCYKTSCLSLAVPDHFISIQLSQASSSLESIDQLELEPSPRN